MTKKMEKLREVSAIINERIKELEIHIFVENINNTNKTNPEKNTQKMIIS